MRVVGLVGGIASGKSTACEELQSLGAVVLNADLIGHETYAPGAECYEALIATFGVDILADDSDSVAPAINRRALGAKVFGQPEAMNRLTSIVWPAIRARLEEKLEQWRKEEVAGGGDSGGGGLCVVIEAAIMLEAGWQDLCDEVWVISTPETVACTRLMARNQLSRKDALKRLASQMKDAQREAQAHLVIRNDGSIDNFRRDIRHAFHSNDAHLLQAVREQSKRRFRQWLIFCAVAAAALWFASASSSS